MVALNSILALTGFATLVSSTGLLLPLYIYPSAEWNDGAANWKPVFNAISATSSLPWTVVVNVDSGPGGTRKPGDTDPNYIAGTTKLNSYKNVKTVGYVHTNYGKTPMNELKANITAWNGWKDYGISNIAVKGIFFDESSTDNFNYLDQAIKFARTTFKNPITVICNFGVKAGAKYYKICDVVLAYESALNQPGLPPYKSTTTLKNSVPAGSEAKAAIIVNQFTGKAVDGSVANAKLLNTYTKAIADYGLGWCYFTSADYDNISKTPATIGAVAKSLVAANA